MHSGEDNTNVIRNSVDGSSTFAQDEHYETMTTKQKIGGECSNRSKTSMSFAGTCNDGRYGRVGVAVMHAGAPNAYRFAQQTLECYINRTGYEFMVIDVTTDEHVRHACRHAQVYIVV